MVSTDVNISIFGGGGGVGRSLLLKTKFGKFFDVFVFASFFFNHKVNFKN